MDRHPGVTMMPPHTVGARSHLRNERENVSRPSTTASILAKSALTAVGVVITGIGFVTRARGYGSMFAVHPVDPELARIGSWLLVGGAVWMLVSIVAWLFSPGAWDVIAPFLVGLMLALAIIATLLISAALTLTGRPSLIDPSEGVPWRISLTIGVLAIGLAQMMVAQALVGREPPVPSMDIWRLRISATAVLFLGIIAAWTSPVALVAVLTLASLVYIAIELAPRGT